MNQFAQDNTPSGGDICAQSFNLNFGDLNNPLTVNPENPHERLGKAPLRLAPRRLRSA